MSQEQHVKIRPRSQVFCIPFGEIWNGREILYRLALRDLQVRYKQTILGVLWAIVQPLITVTIYTVIFGGLVKVDTGDVPYALNAFSGILPWMLFSAVMSHASNCLIDNQALFTKIYFPRLILPMSSLFNGVIDFVIASIVMIFLQVFVWGIPVDWPLLTLPIWMVLTLLTAFGIGLWLSALNALYRDVKHVVPFMLQIWFYLTPIIYAINLIPAQYRPIYMLNPMAGVITGFRWCLIPSAPVPGWEIAVSFFVIICLVVSGIFYFNRMERYFADVV